MILPRLESIKRPKVTVATVVERDGKFLFVVERIRGQLVINQPAGHLDPGESLIDAAIRETREESAYLIQPNALIGIYQWVSPNDQKHFVRFVFCAEIVDHIEGQALDSGIEGTLWLNAKELQTHELPTRSELVTRSVHDYLSGQRYPLAIVQSLLPPTPP